MQKRKLEPKFNLSTFKFENPSDSITGTVNQILEVDTIHGKKEKIVMVTNEGEETSIWKSGQLYGYNWEELIGKVIEIVYTGDEKITSGKGKGTYKKVYEVSEVES